MSEDTPKENPSAFMPPVSSFTGPIAELIAQRMLSPPPRPGLLAVLDHFEILRLLGGGGMGVVLLARDSDTGRDVAIKLVKSDLVTNQNVVHRFLREAGHLKRLRHTNIVPVQEISDRAEGPYFVMPYFEKGSLANRIKPGQPLDTETILDIAAQVAEGLSFAHRSGIIHRDLKPANILLDANGQVCLADFGLARTMFNDTIVDVESRHLEGTAPYMSPAVAAGDAEDTRCDIYSFGALLYEMLTGHPPYKGRSSKEILDQILAGPPRSITSLNPDADRGLVAVAEGCMARELRDRYADMRDVLKDLQRIKENKQPMGQRRFKGAVGNKLSQVSRVLKVIWIPACLAAIGLLGWMFWRERSTVVIASQPIPTRGVSSAKSAIGNRQSAPPPIQAAAVSSQPALNVTTLAGQVGVGGYADGTGNQAQFRLPNNVAVDNAGNVYVADTGNNTIREITPTGAVSTLAGVAGSHGSCRRHRQKARFWAPFGIAVDQCRQCLCGGYGQQYDSENRPEWRREHVGRTRRPSRQQRRHRRQCAVSQPLGCRSGRHGQCLCGRHEQRDHSEDHASRRGHHFGRPGRNERQCGWCRQPAHSLTIHLPWPRTSRQYLCCQTAPTTPYGRLRQAEWSSTLGRSARICRQHRRERQ